MNKPTVLYQPSQPTIPWFKGIEVHLTERENQYMLPPPSSKHLEHHIQVMTPQKPMPVHIANPFTTYQTMEIQSIIKCSFDQLNEKLFNKLKCKDTIL